MRPTFLHTVAFVASVGTAFADDDPEPENPCKSFGIDFQDNGKYFQNKSSTEPFTFVSTFEKCEEDVATNILVDPVGDQYLCSDTPMRPDDTFQMSTCPLNKDSLWTGDWSVIIISNNGDAAPIAYQRDFALKVDIPITKTVTPTVTVTAVETPTKNVTSTNVITEVITSTKVVTSPYTKSKTVTKTPKLVRTTKTITLGTITKHAYKVEPTVITKTRTKTCSVPKRQNHRDPWATITPTVAYAAALETPAATTTPAKSYAGGARGRRDAARLASQDRAEFLAARRARLAVAEGIEKRGLDEEEVETTEVDTAKWNYVTAWTTGPATTSTVVVDSTKSTTTVSTSTSYKGVTQVIKTITAPTPTRTKTKYTLARTTSTITKRPTFTKTIKWAPASSTAICKAKGGKLKV